MKRTLYNELIPVRALPITTIAIDGIRSGSVIDTGIFANDFRTVAFTVFTGAVTDGTYAFTVQDSDDGSTGWADVASSQIQGSLPTLTSADDFRHDIFFGVAPVKQYLRLQVTAATTSSGGLVGATALLAEASISPPLRTGS
jgi:hypothetical protein